MPLGSKTCDMCATMGAIAPAQPVGRLRKR